MCHRWIAIVIAALSATGVRTGSCLGDVIFPIYDVNSAVLVSSFTDYSPSELVQNTQSPAPIAGVSHTYSQTFGPYSPGNYFITDSTTLGGFAGPGHLGATLDVSTGTRITEYVTAGYTDYLTFTSDTLPLGTQVLLQSTYTLHANFNQSGDVAGAYASSNAGYLFDSGVVTSTYQWSAHVGETVSFSDYLSLVATVLGDFNGGYGTLLIDALNTSNTYLTVLTPGVTYTSASGHSYAAPSSVPEPASLTLVGLGALGMAYGAIRRRRNSGLAAS